MQIGDAQGNSWPNPSHHAYTNAHEWTWGWILRKGFWHYLTSALLGHANHSYQ